MKEPQFNRLEEDLLNHRLDTLDLTEQPSIHDLPQVNANYNLPTETELARKHREALLKEKALRLKQDMLPVRNRGLRQPQKKEAPAFELNEGTQRALAHNKLQIALLQRQINELEQKPELSKTEQTQKKEQLQKTQMQRLMEAIAKNRSLVQINLSHYALSAEYVACLVTFINSENNEEKAELESLTLNNCHLNDETADMLFTALKANSVISRLDLTDNSLSIVAMATLAEAITNNEHLQVLSLASNADIGADGLTLLVESLKTNQELTELNLSYCNLGDEGGNLICEIIRNNQHLRCLSLNGNHLTDQFMDNFLEALKFNDGLREINLGNNPIDTDKIDLIPEYLGPGRPVFYHRPELIEAERVAEEKKKNALKGMLLEYASVQKRIKKPAPPAVPKKKTKRRLGLG